MINKTKSRIRVVLLVIFAAISFVCFKQIDTRQNRIEANGYAVCVKQVGANHCYKGTWVDPAPGFF